MILTGDSVTVASRDRFGYAGLGGLTPSPETLDPGKGGTIVLRLRPVNIPRKPLDSYNFVVEIVNKALKYRIN
jgi:hypothetical protein